MSDQSNKPESDMWVKGHELVETVKKILHEGNVRKITIKNKNGDVIASFPLTAGVVGMLVAPILAAVGGIAAIMTECRILVEKKEE